MSRSVIGLVLGTLLACAPPADQFGLPAGIVMTDAGTIGDGGTVTDAGPTGLPCDVATFLQTNCETYFRIKNKKSVHNLFYFLKKHI